MVPETVALHLTKGRSQRCETGNTGRLPIDILNVEPFFGVCSLVVAVKNDITSFFKCLEAVVAHEVGPFQQRAHTF